MGEIADAMLNGTLCAHCGEYLDREPTGNPEYCDDECRKEADGNPEAHKAMRKELEDSYVTIPSRCNYIEDRKGGIIIEFDMVKVLTIQIQLLNKALLEDDRGIISDIIQEAVHECIEIIECIEGNTKAQKEREEKDENGL